MTDDPLFTEQDVQNFVDVASDDQISRPCRSAA